MHTSLSSLRVLAIAPLPPRSLSVAPPPLLYWIQHALLLYAPSGALSLSSARNSLSLSLSLLPAPSVSSAPLAGAADLDLPGP
jgi:hypothetical protein